MIIFKQIALICIVVLSSYSIGLSEAADSKIPIDPLIERGVHASFEEIAKAATKIEITRMCRDYTAYYFEGYTTFGSYTTWCCVFYEGGGPKKLVEASRGNCYHFVNMEMIERYCSEKK